jgi:hypothetical protein
MIGPTTARTMIAFILKKIGWVSLDKEDVKIGKLLELQQGILYVDQIKFWTTQVKDQMASSYSYTSNNSWLQ